MLNNQKIILLSKLNTKKIKKAKQKVNLQFSKIISKVKENEISKLKNPKNGDLFVYVDSNDEYNFFQYSGKLRYLIN